MPRWTRKDTILRSILERNNDENNEVRSVRDTIKELIPHLENSPLYRHLSTTVIEDLKQSTTFHSFNRGLNKVWDYVDDNDIWVEF